MRRRRGNPIGPMVRIACGVMGGVLILLAILGARQNPPVPAVAVILMLAMASLFLIPALLSGPRPRSRSAERHNRLTLRVGLAGSVLGWTGTAAALVAVLVSRIIDRSRDPWSAGRASRSLIAVATSLWFLGFVLRFFHTYYLNQEADEPEGREVR